MPQFRKKPVVIGAEQYREGAYTPPFVCFEHEPPNLPFVETLEGPLRVSDGDYIITGVKGEHYPCKPDIFAATYVPADQPTSPMRRFNLVRDQDVTGVSGTGVVAEGVVFSTGQVCMTWLTAINSTVIYPSIDNVQHIHGHGGATRIVWLDEV